MQKCETTKWWNFEKCARFSFSLSRFTPFLIRSKLFLYLCRNVLMRVCSGKNNNNGFIYNSRESNWNKWPRFRFGMCKKSCETIEKCRGQSVTEFCCNKSVIFWYVLLDFTYIFKHTAHVPHFHEANKNERKKEGKIKREQHIVYIFLFAFSFILFFACIYISQRCSTCCINVSIYILLQNGTHSYTHTCRERHEKNWKREKVSIIYRLADCTYLSFAYVWKLPFFSFDGLGYSLWKEQKSLFSLSNMFRVSYKANFFSSPSPSPPPSPHIFLVQFASSVLFRIVHFA